MRRKQSLLQKRWIRNKPPKWVRDSASNEKSNDCRPFRMPPPSKWRIFPRANNRPKRTVIGAKPKCSIALSKQGFSTDVTSRICIFQVETLGYYQTVPPGRRQLPKEIELPNG